MLPGALKWSITKNILWGILPFVVLVYPVDHAVFAAF